jgi:hypothetical protein
MEPVVGGRRRAVRGLSKDPADFEYTPPPERTARARRILLTAYRIVMVVVTVLLLLRLAHVL